MPDPPPPDDLERLIDERAPDFFDIIKVKWREYRSRLTTLEQQLHALELRQDSLTAELQRAAERAKYSIDTLETIPQPSIRVDDHNLIHRVNNLAQKTFDYRLSDLEGRSIFTLVHEGELQILELAAHYEELSTFLGYKDLDEIPVTLVDKQKKLHLLAADIHFQAGHTPGYHGATLALKQRPKHPINRIMPTIHTVLKTREFSDEDGVFTNYNAPLADGRVFGNLVISPFVHAGKGRKKITIIDLEGISRCGDEAYNFLVNIQSHFHQSDPSFDIRVYTSDASLTEELCKRGFPQENVSFPKKKQKKKEK